MSDESKKLTTMEDAEEFINKIEHDGVVDFESYRAWRKTLLHPIVGEKRVIDTSDGKTIDLGLLQFDLVKRIKHLPEKERNKIMAMKKVYSTIMGRSNVYKKRAFKISPHNGFKGTMTSILDSRKDELIELFGRLFSSKEVLEIINKEWRMKTSLDTVLFFKRNHAQEIAIKIDEFKRSFGDIRLYHKTSRLEELVWLYLQLKQKFQNSKSKEDYNLMLKTLEQIRKESEGEQLHINGSVEVKIEHSLQHQVQQELRKTLPLREIILGRIAAKSGLSPAIFVKSLNDSHYSKFTRFLDGEASDADFDNVFPSTLTYDFDKIEKVQEERQAQRTIDIEETKERAIPTEEAKSFKDLLLLKLSEKNADNTKNKLDMQIQAEISVENTKKEKKNGGK